MCGCGSRRMAAMSAFRPGRRRAIVQTMPRQVMAWLDRPTALSRGIE